MTVPAALHITTADLHESWYLTDPSRPVEQTETYLLHHRGVVRRRTIIATVVAVLVGAALFSVGRTDTPQPIIGGLVFLLAALAAAVVYVMVAVLIESRTSLDPTYLRPVGLYLPFTVEDVQFGSPAHQHLWDATTIQQQIDELDARMHEWRFDPQFAGETLARAVSTRDDLARRREELIENARRASVDPDADSAANAYLDTLPATPRA